MFSRNGAGWQKSSTTLCLVKLLGGKTRAKVAVYNCAGWFIFVSLDM